MWSVKTDGLTLFATGVQANSRHVLFDPVITEEINSAGGFTFGIPYTNEQYNNIKLMTSTIEVFKDRKIFWRGRPLSVDIGFDRTMNVTCEGALSFLNDTVYPPDSCKLRISLFLDKVIANHNEKCNENRQVHVGSVTMDDVEIEYNGSYTNTMEVVRDLVETYGGYLVCHYAEGGNYFDWLKEIPLEQKDTINVEQIVDIGKSISAEDVVTCVIPVGKDALTIGSEYIENQAATALFGKIWQSVEFSDIDDPDELYNAGLEYLNNNLWSSMQLNISALDVGEDYQVGKMYHARIPSFNINHDIVLMGASISLVNAAATQYTFSAATIWTQISNGKDLAQVVDTAQHLKTMSHGSLTSKTAKMAEIVENEKYFSGDIIFSDNTKITCVNGMITGGKTTEGDF